MLYSKTEYIKKLKAHDWYYGWSDDSFNYSNGIKSEKELIKIQKEIDTDFVIWNAYAPEQFRKNYNSKLYKKKDRPAFREISSEQRKGVHSVASRVHKILNDKYSKYQNNLIKTEYPFGKVTIIWSSKKLNSTGWDDIGEFVVIPSMTFKGNLRVQTRRGEKHPVRVVKVPGTLEEFKRYESKLLSLVNESYKKIKKRKRLENKLINKKSKERKEGKTMPRSNVDVTLTPRELKELEKSRKKKEFKKMTKEERKAHIISEKGQEAYDDYTRGLNTANSITKEDRKNKAFMKGFRKAVKPKSKKQRIAYWEMVKKNAKSDKQKELAKDKLKKLKRK